MDRVPHLCVGALPDGPSCLPERYLDQMKAPREGHGSGMFLVVGTGRCGSTLLQTMLMAHPSVRMPPETQYFQFMDPVALGLPDPLADDAVERYLERVRGNHAWKILNAREPLGPAYEQAVRGGLRSAVDQFCWVCERLSEGQTGTLIGEKTPQHWSYLGRILGLLPGTKVIHIHRDPRDVVAGLMSMPWWKGRSVRRTARYWRRAMEAADAWQERLGQGGHHIVGYERLVEEPRAALEGVCAFLGVPFREEMLAERAAAAERAFRPGEEGHKGLTRGPLRGDRHGRYRTKLSPFQIRLVESTVGAEWMARRGYRPDSDIDRPAWSVLDPAVARVAESLGLAAGCRVRG